MLKRLKDAEKEIARLGESQLLARAPQLADSAEKIGDTVAVVADLGDLPSADALRALVTDIRARLGESAAAVVAGVGVVGERPQLVVATNQLARDAGIKAGALVKVGAKALKGGGGGRDDIAQGGGRTRTIGSQ